MGKARARSVTFFVQYFVLLLAALGWVQIAPVRERTGADLRLFYALIGAAFVYVALRCYLVVGRGISKQLSYLWLTIDLLLITATVRLTGGLDSEAALLYVWPLATSSIQRLPRRTLVAGLSSGVLYVAATWVDRADPNYVSAMAARLLILVLATSQAVVYALAESARIEETARLRERLALADYRDRLAGEMHDGLQHYLADISMHLELARRLMSDDPAEAATLAVDQRYAVRRAADELRYLIRLLRSPAVDREGFLAALRNHLDTFGERASVSTPLEIEGPSLALSPEVAHAAFRIIQEALTNVEKHAEARQAKVTLRFGDHSFECLVTDDGVGFCPARASQSTSAGTGFGLSSMRQRAMAVGGELEISSTPGGGTDIRFSVPLKASKVALSEGVRNGSDQTAHRRG
ncbi:MAG: sensor histidine kinase [Armatimonadota bacterium]|nr:MAG: sensor histidine kinase [Armatimonadota bacterium]